MQHFCVAIFTFLSAVFLAVAYWCCRIRKHFSSEDICVCANIKTIVNIYTHHLQSFFFFCNLKKHCLFESIFSYVFILFICPFNIFYPLSLSFHSFLLFYLAYCFNADNYLSEGWWTVKQKLVGFGLIPSSPLKRLLVLPQYFSWCLDHAAFRQVLWHMIT